MLNAAVAISSAGELALRGPTHEFQSSAGVSGNGLLRCASGNTTLGGVINVGRMIVESDLVELRALTETDEYEQSGGAVDGVGALDVSTMLTWSGGEIGGTGNVTARGLSELTGASNKTLSRWLVNRGDLRWPGAGWLLLTGSTHIHIPVGGVVEVSLATRTLWSDRGDC